MVGYVTFGTNDFERAVTFYDAVLAEVGLKRLWTHGGMAAWGRDRASVALCVTAPYDGEPATVGNGVMVALRMTSREDVDKVHAMACRLGGVDEGAPGPRGEHGFYGGYFRDRDGNKLNAYLPA